jgi:hypothetical protein
MRRSFLRYTRLLILPLLAVGLVLTGCDSGGSNNGGGGESTIDEPYPDPTSDAKGYEEETAINLQLAGLGIRLGDTDNPPSSSTLNSIYDGSVGDISIQRIPSDVTASAETYGELDVVADIKTQIQDFNDPILRSDQLEQGVDASNTSGLKTADELISFYLNEAKQSSANGVAFDQFAEKGVASALSYADAAAILNDFAADGSVSGDAETKWNEAFGHFGAPHSFGEFFNVTANNNGGIPDGRFQNADGGPDVDVYSEAVYIWAGYTAERAAAAEATGNPNNFAADAFNAFVDGRQAIDSGNDPSSDAADALQAWEETVAVNVIHYINGLEGRLEDLPDGDMIADNSNDDSTPSDIDEGAWGEAKAFLWALQFESQLSDQDLRDIHNLLGAAPPYGDLTVGEYEDDLEEATEIIAVPDPDDDGTEENPNAYDFASENVQKW